MADDHDGERDHNPRQPVPQHKAHPDSLSVRVGYVIRFRRDGRLAIVTEVHPLGCWTDQGFVRHGLYTHFHVIRGGKRGYSPPRRMR